MKNNKLKQLELLYVQLNFAYNSNDENEMKILFNKFGNQFPELGEYKIHEIRKVFTNHKIRPFIIESIKPLNGIELNYNIEGCLNTMWSILGANKYQTFSPNCIKTIYYPQKTFTPTDILYQTLKQNSDNKQTNTLTVSDLLSIARYSLQVLEIIQPNEKSSNISDTITVMQSIDLALCNKPHDIPINKSLHVVNGILSSIVKHHLEKESDRKFVTTMGLLIDLAIDFFIAK